MPTQTVAIKDRQKMAKPRTADKARTSKGGSRGGSREGITIHLETVTVTEHWGEMAPRMSGPSDHCHRCRLQHVEDEVGHFGANSKWRCCSCGVMLVN